MVSDFSISARRIGRPSCQQQTTLCWTRCRAGLFLRHSWVTSKLRRYSGPEKYHKTFDSIWHSPRIENSNKISISFSDQVQKLTLPREQISVHHASTEANLFFKLNKRWYTCATENRTCEFRSQLILNRVWL